MWFTTTYKTRSSANECRHKSFFLRPNDNNFLQWTAFISRPENALENFPVCKKQSIIHMLTSSKTYILYCNNDSTQGFCSALSRNQQNISIDHGCMARDDFLNAITLKVFIARKFLDWKVQGCKSHKSWSQSYAHYK